MSEEQPIKQRVRTERGRAMVKRASENTALMEQAHASRAAHKRGERGTPGRQVHDEWRKRRDEELRRQGDDA